MTTVQIETTAYAIQVHTEGTSADDFTTAKGETPDLLGVLRDVAATQATKPDPAVIEELIEWAMNRAPTDGERIRAEAWQRD